ncbi:MAG: CHRD domain-containing protein [Gemmatimonadota bacterium]|nr:MAG: CHRD domain-containing protein [Gemmatimonadota bacterium]
MSRSIFRATLATITALAVVVGCSNESQTLVGPNEDLTEDPVERALSDVPIGTEFIAVLEGSQVVPPVDTDARGAAFFSVTQYWYDETGSRWPLEIRFDVIAARVSAVTQVQIHLGWRGMNGPAVANLPLTDQAPTYEVFTIEGSLSDEDIIPVPELGFDGTVAALAGWMRRGAAYIDLHTVGHPSGEIRGQIYPFVIPPPPPPPTTFYSVLNGANEVPPVNTPAHGRARFELTAGTAGLYFHLEATQIERVTAAHIHLGREGANGPVVAVLLGLPIDGSNALTTDPPIVVPAPGIVVDGTLTDDDIVPRPELGFDGTLAALLTWMRSSAAYVNVRTVRYPDGEIRGQIHPALHPCPTADCETEIGG